MSEESGTRKISKQELNPAEKEQEDALTGEEIERIADLFADEPPQDEQDTGEFHPGEEDTGSFKPVE